MGSEEGCECISNAAQFKSVMMRAASMRCVKHIAGGQNVRRPGTRPQAKGMCSKSVENGRVNATECKDDAEESGGLVGIRSS